MLIMNTRKPNTCAFCGNYLTTSEEYAGYRCIDPGHWQAAGLLTARDFYPLALVAAQAGSEMNRRYLTRQYQTGVVK